MTPCRLKTFTSKVRIGCFDAIRPQRHNDGFVFTRHPVSNPSSTTPAGNYGNLQLAVATAMALTLHFTMHKEEIRQVQEANIAPDQNECRRGEGGGGMFKEELK